MQYGNRPVACQWRDGLAHAWYKALDIVLPPHCVLCGLPCGPACICRTCRSELTFAGPHCRQCGLPLSSKTDALCGACIRFKTPFTTTVYPLQYLFPADRLVQAFKFNRQLAAGRILARLMCEWLNDRQAPCPDSLVPVPLHTLRMFKRGFNQAFELAACINREMGIPLQAGALRRRRNTRAQSGLTAQQRRRNVRGAFYWHSRRPPPRHVALIDDVMTTGTTVGECARVLKQCGARRVDVWVAARAVAPYQQ